MVNTTGAVPADERTSGLDVHWGGLNHQDRMGVGQGSRARSIGWRSTGNDSCHGTEYNARLSNDR
jgi:hypothetical protein